MSNSNFLPLLCLSIIESNIYFYGLLFLMTYFTTDST